MEFNIKSNIKKKLKNPVLLIGLPGIGLVGKIVVEYLVKNLKAKKIGEIDGSFFPPMVLVNDTNEVKLITDNLFLYNGKEQDFLFLTGDFQPYLDDALAVEQHHYFSKKIIEFAKKEGVKKVYTFAGLDIGDTRITKNSDLYFATNNKKEVSKLKAKKIKLATNGLTISGVAGLTLGYAYKEGISGVCILSETSSKLIYGDFDAAKNILKFVKKELSLDLNLKDIQKDARKITDAFKKVVEELKTIPRQEKESKLTYIR